MLRPTSANRQVGAVCTQTSPRAIPAGTTAAIRSRSPHLIPSSLLVTSGATINAQVWARDPANADGFLMSDGVEFTVCP